MNFQCQSFKDSRIVMKSRESPSTLLFALQNCNIRLRTCWHCAWHTPWGSVSKAFIATLSHKEWLCWEPLSLNRGSNNQTSCRRSMFLIQVVVISGDERCYPLVTVQLEVWAVALEIWVGWHSWTGKQKYCFHTRFLLLPLLADAKGWSGKAALKFWGALTPVTMLIFI